jgi:alpha-beta hydrolase superfamily lysophospholipase
VFGYSSGAILALKAAAGELLATVTAPALVVTGQNSPQFLRSAIRAAAAALPHGRGKPKPAGPATAERQIRPPP